MGLQQLGPVCHANRPSSLFWLPLCVRRAEHHAVLQSVLPQATIDRLCTELDWEAVKKSKHEVELVEVGECVSMLALPRFHAG